MLNIREISKDEQKIIDEIVSIHISAFEGFFLTFLGRGLLKQLYRSYCEYAASGIYAAFDEDSALPLGFLAYSGDMSGMYTYMIKKKLFKFMWFSIGAFFRNPKVFIRLIRAFLKPNESKRNERYIELASIGVKPQNKECGIGTKLIKTLCANVDFSKYEYIALETDAIGNDSVNRFYQKNGFVKARTYSTNEGRKMNEYRYYGGAG